VAIKPRNRIIADHGRFEQAYNAQAAVETDGLLVVEQAITQAANDKEQVVPMLEQLKELPK